MLREVLLASVVAVVRRACSGMVGAVIVGNIDLLPADAMAYRLLVNNGSLRMCGLHVLRRRRHLCKGRGRQTDRRDRSQR